MLRDDFLAEIRAYLASHGVSATRFGREALNDPNFVFDIEDGRSARFDTVEKVRRFMAERGSGGARP